jgi:hypothetical protein
MPGLEGLWAVETAAAWLRQHVRGERFVTLLAEDTHPDRQARWLRMGRSGFAAYFRLHVADRFQEVLDALGPRIGLELAHEGCAKRILMQPGRCPFDVRGFAGSWRAINCRHRGPINRRVHADQTSRCSSGKTS